MDQKSAIKIEPRSKRKKSVQFQQPYNEVWEKLPIFQGWLSSVPHSKSRALCKCCKKEFRAHRTDLRAHAQSRKHKKNVVQMYINEEKLQNAVHMSSAKSSQLDENDSDENTFIMTESSDTFDQYFTTGSEPEDRLHGTDKDSSLTEYPRTDQDERPQKHLFISTQVQDMVKGAPIDRLVIYLFTFQNNEWMKCGEGITESDGRCSNFKIFNENANLPFPGHYKLRYETKMHFTLNLDDSIFPFIEISFEVLDQSDRYEVNLLLSPFGYMVYKKQ